MSIEDFQVGQRIETHPATDAWMSGDRFGKIVKVGRKLIYVRMDRSERTRIFDPNDISRIVDNPRR